MIYVSAIIIAYLLGSIPVGLVLTKLTGKGDIRKVGSGSTGATNVMRVGGLKLAGLVWLLDMAKAMLAVGLGYCVGSEGFAALCGLFAIIGHAYPVWLDFKGGKGVSCMFGALLVISPMSFAAIAVIWLFVALSSGYSSLGAIISFFVLPVLGFTISFNVGLVFIAMSALCLWLHRENIMRLVKGTESKIEWKWKK